MHRNGSLLNGNITTAPLNGTPSTFAFDCRNRLASVGNTSYTYNAENQRIGITENGVSTSYVINPNAALSQTLIKTTGGVSTYYVYGLGLIAEETGTDYKTYHYDLRGSTVALADNVGLVTDTFSYAPYGELLSHTGTSDVDYLYNGRDGVIADNNGLYQMRARYYSPELRRFLNEDEYAGKYDDILNVNLYAYCEGNPVGFVDPSGRTTFAVPFSSGLALNPAIELNPWIAPFAGVWLYYEATKGLEDEPGGPTVTDRRDIAGLGTGAPEPPKKDKKQRNKPVEYGKPNSVDIIKDFEGNVVKYTEYGPDGRLIKEVRLQGTDHGSIPRPNVKYPDYNVNPVTGESFMNGYKVRPAEPWEILKYLGGE